MLSLPLGQGSGGWLSRLIDVRRYSGFRGEKSTSGYTGLTSGPEMPAYPEPQDVTLLEMPHRWSQVRSRQVRAGPGPMTGGLVSLAVRTCVKH